MNTRLNHIENWLELAKRANWSASKLAKQSDVSLRTLERFFLKHKDNTPQKWLRQHRQLQAIELLREGCSVKESAAQLGYKHATNFSRDFRIYWGVRPATAIIRSKSLVL